MHMLGQQIPEELILRALCLCELLLLVDASARSLGPTHNLVKPDDGAQSAESESPIRPGVLLAIELLRLRQPLKVDKRRWRGWRRRSLLLV